MNREVRAKVWSTKYRGSPRTWHYAVLNSAGVVVLYDNTGGGRKVYNKILRSALIRVTALRHMEIAGHKLGEYTGYHAKRSEA